VLDSRIKHGARRVDAVAGLRSEVLEKLDFPVVESSYLLPVDNYCANYFAVTQATKDAVATGIGVIIFWPSLLFIGGDKQTAAQIAHLKGQMDAIQQESIRKNCGIQFQTAPPPRS
jgi:hypothetical protein